MHGLGVRGAPGGRQPHGLALGQHSIPRCLAVGQRRCRPGGCCGLHGDFHGAAVVVMEVLGVDFGDGSVDDAAAGLVLCGAQVVACRKFGAVFREQRHVFVKELRRRRQWVGCCDVDDMIVMAMAVVIAATPTCAVMGERVTPRCIRGIL